MTSSTNQDFIEKVNAFCNLANNTNPYNILDIELMKKNVLDIYDELLQLTPVAPSFEEAPLSADSSSETNTDMLPEEKVEEKQSSSVSEPKPEKESFEAPEAQTLFETEDSLFENNEPEHSVEIPEETPKDTTETSDANNTPEVSSTVHDILADMQQNDDMLTMLAKQQISSLTKAITINDKIEFVRELFDGNGDTYKTVISKLDQSKDLNEAMNHLKELNLDKEKPSTEKLIKLVYRRFI